MTFPTMTATLSLGILLLSLLSAHANPPQEARHVYTIRTPKVDRRRAVEIIDLETFVLTNSEDGRPKSMIPFLLTIAETRTELSDQSIENVETALNDFLLAELNDKVFEWDSVSKVQSELVSQERIVEELNGRKLHLDQNTNNHEYGVRGRKLASVTGTQFEVRLNVTFDREPSPDTRIVEQSLQKIMQKDLKNLVNNITATEDPELGYVFMAYREEISTANENPTTTTADIQVEVEETKAQEGQSINFIIPVLIGLVMMGAIIALLAAKRRRRRVQAASEKAQADLAFLDEETNVFSFENSPTKLSAKKKIPGVDTNDYDADEDGSARSLTSSQASPSYGNMSGMGSPTARSSMSGAETVKVSNAKIMPLPSKLTELASTSLFAFSEEDEDYDDSTEDRSQKTSESQQPSDVSNGSSFNRIMNGKSDEEGILSISGSPRHEVGSTGATPMPETPTGQSSISSFFSSHFFSGGASALTVQAANTTKAIKQKAAKQGVRSFSLSPRGADKSGSPSGRARAKSVTDGDDGSVDSVFDFAAPLTKTRSAQNLQASGDNQNNQTDSSATSGTPSSFNGTAADRNGVNSNLAVSSVAASTASGSAPSTPAGTARSTPKATVSPASASGLAVVTGALLSSAADTSSVVATPPTVLKSNVSNSTLPTSTHTANGTIKSSEEFVPSGMNPIRYLKNVAMIPRNQSHQQAITNPQAQLRHYTPDASAEELMSEEDSLSDAPGSFPRRSRRHAKSTTHDGTFAYQTNAMQPQDWSMTDGCSDDDTLSEQGGGFGAFPKTGIRSPRSGNKKSDVSNERSPTNMSRSSYSAITQTSPASKTDSSQASASRQLINDLVWLSKKIAGVKQSAVDNAPGESSGLGSQSQIGPADSLSYASQDGLISPTSAPGTGAVEQETSVSSTLPDAPGKDTNTSIICRDCYAPPGKLNIVIHSTKDGPAVYEVKEGSCLEGKIFSGDLIIAVDDTDTRAFTAAQLMKIMADKSSADRKITVLHFDDIDEAGETGNTSE